VSLNAIAARGPVRPSLPNAAVAGAVTKTRVLPAAPWTASAITVSFYLPDQQALEGREADTLDCDRDWHVFGTGVYVWVLQTFVRLRAAGAPVRLTRTAPLTGIVVTHSDYVERLLAEARSPADLTIVSARADRPPQTYADVEIVQNASSVGNFQIFVPSWTQPGLIPRHIGRGTRIENVAYVGARKQLHPEFADRDWRDALRRRGLSWSTRMVTFTGNDQCYAGHGWNDYATTDVVVALRPPALWTQTTKPGAKLTNAWAAGVPAILSPERPYRELRQSPLDYLEARNAIEALAAIDQLCGDPQLYTAMIENGIARAREFDAQRLTARWAEVLWRTVPARTGRPGCRLGARFRGYRALARRALRLTRP